MAAAVLEALHESVDPQWHSVDLEILPGVSASLATAAQAGAPLGHDFCVMSLSDNLKPWSIIEKRLDLAAEADLALAFAEAGLVGVRGLVDAVMTRHAVLVSRAHPVFG